MINRRHFLAGSTASLGLLPGISLPAFGQNTNAKNGRLKQSVARWCFADFAIEPLCEELQDMGVSGMDLVDYQDWDVCEKYDILPCLVFGAGSFNPAPDGSSRRFGPSVGWNKTENHELLLATGIENIERASAAGLPNVIGLFGDREGMSDEQGIENCVIGLQRLLPTLEANNVVIGLEVLNSIVDHIDYQGDNTAYAIEVCQRINSEHVKLVYDIYHMQIMEGNIISTIRENFDWFAHYHIAGVPGRHEIDDTQEVNWRGVANAIADLGFDGYVAHEWLPSTENPMDALRHCVDIITV